MSRIKNSEEREYYIKATLQLGWSRNVLIHQIDAEAHKPQYGIHRFIKNIKGVSSHILRKEFKHLKTKLPTLWTNSYFISTVGGAPLSVIEQYIESQKTSQRQ